MNTLDELRRLYAFTSAAIFSRAVIFTSTALVRHFSKEYSVGKPMNPISEAQRV